MTLTGISSSSFTGTLRWVWPQMVQRTTGLRESSTRTWSHSSPQDGQERVICILYEWNTFPYKLMEAEERIICRGHPLVRGIHPTTFEVTTEDHLTRAGGLHHRGPR